MQHAHEKAEPRRKTRLRLQSRRQNL